MDKSEPFQAIFGVSVFALTFLGSVGAVAKALGGRGGGRGQPKRPRPGRDPLTPASPYPPIPMKIWPPRPARRFSSGAGSIGQGFVKGAKVTGKAFKTAGHTMAKGFKKAGRSIRDYFLGKKEGDVEESDLSGVIEETGEAASSARDPISDELDAVGNDMPRQAERKSLSKQPVDADSATN